MIYFSCLQTCLSLSRPVQVLIVHVFLAACVPAYVPVVCSCKLASCAVQWLTVLPFTVLPIPDPPVKDELLVLYQSVLCVVSGPSMVQCLRESMSRDLMAEGGK